MTSYKASDDFLKNLEMIRAAVHFKRDSLKKVGLFSLSPHVQSFESNFLRSRIKVGLRLVTLNRWCTLSAHLRSVLQIPIFFLRSLHKKILLLKQKGVSKTVVLILIAIENHQNSRNTISQPECYVRNTGLKVASSVAIKGARWLLLGVSR